MSAASRSQDNSNQFLRPKFDLHSAAVRLALRGEGFTSSIKFADAISTNVPEEFADALLEALGHRSVALGYNNLCANFNLNNTVPSTCNEADTAAEIPALLADAKNGKDNAVACPKQEFPPPLMMAHLMVGPHQMATQAQELQRA